MHVTFIIIGALAGLCGFGFLLAAIVSFSELAKPQRSTPTRLWLLEFVTGGWASVFIGISRHWRTQPDLRALTYYGASSLALAGVMVALACVTAE